MTTKTLVFGDDGSAEADRVWHWITSQNWDGWRAQVITADPPDIPTRLSAPGADKPHKWEPPQPRTAPSHTALGDIEHLRAEVDPRIALTEIEGASVIVVGPRGAGAMKALGIGSTAEYLLAGAPAPLLISRGESPVERTLVCADGSEFSIHAAEAAAGLPWISGSEVTVMTVNPNLGHDPEGVDRAVGALEAAGARVNRTTGEGKVSRAIEDEAERTGTDLIVVGTRSIAGLRKALLGSTTSWLARHAACSVLVAFPEVAS